MRSFFIVFVFYCFSGSAQSNRVELQIKADDKISVHGFSYWKELKIVSKDTSFIYPLHTKNPDVVSNLKQGSYTITVNSIFNKRESKKVTLQKKSTLLKFTGLSAIYRSATGNLSEKIKLNDTLYIISSDNTGSTNEKIGITKTNGGFTAILYEGLTNTIFNYMQCPPDLYKYVVDFEASLKKANASKAETAPNKKTYSIGLNKEINSFVIPNDTEGMNKLKAILFAVRK